MLVEIAIIVIGFCIGSYFIHLSLKDARAILSSGKELDLDRLGTQARKPSRERKSKQRLGEKICILCGEREAQEGTDVCWHCENEDVGTALIYDMPDEEVP